MGGAWLRPPLPYPLAQKIFPRTVGGPAVQAPTSERQGLCKNSTALSKFHRRGEHCSPAKALRYHKAPGWSRAPPLQYAARECVEFLTLFCDFAVGAGLCSARLAVPAGPKSYPRSVAGLQCRPLQAKGKAYAKILSFFRNFIVGASIARPPLPQLQTPKYFPAPLRACNAGPYKQKIQAYAKILSLFQNFIV